MGRGCCTDSSFGSPSYFDSVLASLLAHPSLARSHLRKLFEHSRVHSLTPASSQNLLNDLLRISWARYHQDIASHSLHMHAILHFPVPKPGERISLPVSAEISQADTFFVAVNSSLSWLR